MNITTKDNFKLSDHASYFFDLPFITNLVPQSLVRIDDCLTILKKYPGLHNESVIYQLERIKEQVQSEPPTSDAVRKTLESISSLLQSSIITKGI